MLLLCALFHLAPLQETAAAELVSRCLPEEPVRRTLAGSYELALAGSKITVDGAERPAPQGPSYSLRGALELRLAEKVESCVGGRVLRFVRSYELLRSSGGEETAGKPGEEGTQQSWSEGSTLEGLRVRFALDGEEWSARWADEADAPRAKLPPSGLVAELDLAFLVPQRVARVGESWTVDPRAAAELFRPWRGIPFGEEDPELGPEVEEHEDPTRHEGSVRVRLDALEERESGLHARLALELELLEARDLTERARAGNEGGELPPGTRRPRIDAMSDTTTYRGGGSAIWDVRRGRLVALELDCDTEQVQLVRSTLTMGEKEGLLERTTTLRGRFSLRARCE